MRLSLAVLTGPQKGRIYSFTCHDVFLAGRSRQAHFQAPAKDTFFSPFHFLLEINPPVCRLLDLNSDNGLLVNGEKVTAADLGHRDRIQVGRTIFQLFVQDSETGQPARAGNRSQPLLPQRSAPTPARKPEAAVLSPGELHSPWALRQLKFLPGVCGLCQGPLAIANSPPEAP